MRVSSYSLSPVFDEQKKGLMRVTVNGETSICEFDFSAFLNSIESKFSSCLHIWKQIQMNLETEKRVRWDIAVFLNRKTKCFQLAFCETNKECPCMIEGERIAQ
jgi:hypothetical protein